MNNWSLTGVDARGRPERRPCPPIGQIVRLHVLPGADAIQVEIAHGETPIACIEVAASDGEIVAFEVRAVDPPRLAVTGRRLLRLPPRPFDTSSLAVSDHAVDLALVVDATRLAAAEPPEDPTAPWPRHLGSDAWRDEAERWVEIVHTLSQSVDTRCTVLAFGDRPPPYRVAEDLRPAYLVRPPVDDRTFAPFEIDRLRRRLVALRPSAGGDAVDAVDEALDACTRLPWRADARRLVLLIGDSPGYSIEHPAPDGATAMTREQDVDTVAAHLAALGVELATCFAPPPNDAVRTEDHHRLVDHSRRQYRRLASLPAWAFELEDSTLLGDEVAHALAHRPSVLVRGPAPGQWIDPSPNDPETP